MSGPLTAELLDLLVATTRNLGVDHMQALMDDRAFSLFTPLGRVLIREAVAIVRAEETSDGV